jgi:uncharacterized protein YsxB (DUF464 family)
MIEVRVRKNYIQVSGHAGHAPPGQDIVCAGVSALTQALLMSIDSLAEDRIKYRISPGRADIYYGNLSEKSRTLVDSFFIGVCLIADDFPDNVRII